MPAKCLSHRRGLQAVARHFAPSTRQTDGQTDSDHARRRGGTAVAPSNELTNRKVAVCSLECRSVRQLCSSALFHASGCRPSADVPRRRARAFTCLAADSRRCSDVMRTDLQSEGAEDAAVGLLQPSSSLSFSSVEGWRKEGQRGGNGARGIR